MSPRHKWDRQASSIVNGVLFVGLAGVIIGLLFPAVNGHGPGSRVICSNNLKQIGLALHDYRSDYGAFPPAYTVDEDGRVLHSWRTLLLPYLEQQGLYQQIRLDEPWDSVHNRQFADVHLDVYTCPDNDEGLAYLAVTTRGSIFEGPTPCPLSEITDGTWRTIAVIEVIPLAESWMKPVDFDDQKLDRVLAEGLSSLHPGGSQALFTDAAVHFIQEAVDPETFRALLTRDGGEKVDRY